MLLLLLATYERKRKRKRSVRANQIIRKEVRRISLSSTGTVFGCRKIQNVLYRNSNRARWRK